jgi:hypothetical protein
MEKKLRNVNAGIVLLAATMTVLVGIYGFRLRDLNEIANSSAQANVLTWYVSPSGRDSWSGSLPEKNSNSSDGPFKTIERAQKEYRKAKASGEVQNGAQILIREGRYEVGDGIKLSELDSGGQDGHLVISNYEGEKPVLTGAKQISVDMTDTNIASSVSSRFRSSVRNQIKRIDGKIIGEVVGPQYRSWVNEKNPYVTEIFFDDSLGVLARWPNDNGVKRSAKAMDKWSKVLDADYENYTFKYSSKDGSSPSDWSIGQNDIWLHGFFQEDWADYIVKVGGIDAKNSRIEIDENTSSLRNLRSGKRYYALNVLEEIDKAGEYVIDTRNNSIYLLPPAGVENISIAYLVDPIVSCENAQNISIRGLVLQNSRGDGFSLNNCNSVIIEDNTIKNLSKTAIDIQYSRDIIVNNNYIRDTSHGIRSKMNGNRNNLQSANILIENNEITKVGRIIRSYVSPVEIDKSVGVTVRKNKIYDIAHQAIHLLSSNNSIIELNEIYYALQETSDAGVIYMGREWDSLGNVIKNNFIHETDFSQELGFITHGVYLDDGFAGMKIYGNIFYDTGSAIYSKGPLNDISENVFIGNTNTRSNAETLGAVWIANVTSSYVDSFLAEVNGSPYNSDTWAKAYPEWKEYLGKVDSGRVSKSLPYKTKVQNNIFIQNENNISTWQPYFGEPYSSKYGIKLDENISLGSDPGYLDTSNQPARLRRDMSSSLGISAIAVDQIGRDTGKRYVSVSDSKADTPIPPSPVDTTDELPSQPTNLTHQCRGDVAEISWSGDGLNTTSYYLRIDDTSDEWNPPYGCKGVGYAYPENFVGDRCIDKITETQFLTQVEPDIPQKIWVHGANDKGYDGGIGPEVYHEFTCSSWDDSSDEKNLRIRARGTMAKGEFAKFAISYKEKLLPVRVDGLSGVQSEIATESSFKNYDVKIPAEAVISDIKIVFGNDDNVRSGSGYAEDRNLKVDFVEMDSVRYQTEDSGVWSLGSWDSGSGCQAGNKKSEWLHCNGYFSWP